MSEHSFKNSRGRIITTSFPADVEKYRQDPAFEEIPAADVPYKGQKKGDLEDLVAKRNEGRDEADLIVVGGNGTIADLVAALENDDAHTTDD